MTPVAWGVLDRLSYACATTTLRSAAGLGRCVIPRAPAPGKDVGRAGSDATGTRNSSVVHG
jgi:hypothetical protein